MEQGRHLRYEICAEEEGMTIWKFLTQKEKFTKKQVKRMKFLKDGIRVNGIQARVTHVLGCGDVLEVSLDGAQQVQAESIVSDGVQQVQAESIISDGAQQVNIESIISDGTPQVHTESIISANAPQILYEDPDVIAVWKPQGQVLHPSHGHRGDTLMEEVQAFLRQKTAGTSFPALYSIGRLDADTSGIIVFARNQVAAQRLWKQKEEGIFEKQYLAICEGTFPEKAAKERQKIDAPMAPVPGELNKMQVDANGREAVTYYQVLSQTEDQAQILVQLETGRTHQIRVHMAWLGHPLVGDPIYGHGAAGKTHAQLSAFQVKFLQPFTGKEIFLEGQR